VGFVYNNFSAYCFADHCLSFYPLPFAIVLVDLLLIAPFAIVLVDLLLIAPIGK
jgi:hypothetical protein